MTLRNLPKYKMTALIALCPLLVASHSVVTGLSLGLISLLAVIAMTTAIYVCRDGVSQLTKVTITALTAATVAICSTFIIQAFAYELWQTLGVSIFLAGSCGLILIRSPKNHSLGDGTKTAILFLVLLIGIGAIREILGTGKLLSDMHLISGGRALLWPINFFGSGFSGLFLFQSAPSIFFIFGLLVAIKNSLIKERKPEPKETDFIKGAKRVRTTGKIS